MLLPTDGRRLSRTAGSCTRGVLNQQLRVAPEKLAHHYGVANIGAFLSGSTSNALRSANGITTMFIATGQDVATSGNSLPVSCTRNRRLPAICTFL